MGGPFEAFEEELRKQALKKGAKFYQMMISGKSIKEIAQEMALTIEETEEILNELKKQYNNPAK